MNPEISGFFVLLNRYDRCKTAKKLRKSDAEIHLNEKNRYKIASNLCSKGKIPLRFIRKSAAPIRFSAVDFLVIPEISQAIFPT